MLTGALGQDQLAASHDQEPRKADQTCLPHTSFFGLYRVLSPVACCIIFLMVLNTVWLKTAAEFAFLVGLEVEVEMCKLCQEDHGVFQWSSILSPSQFLRRVFVTIGVPWLVTVSIKFDFYSFHGIFSVCLCLYMTFFSHRERFHLVSESNPVWTHLNELICNNTISKWGCILIS